MKHIKTLQSPAFLRPFHGYATLFRLVMAVPSMLFWRNSVAYLVFLSVYAVVAGHWAAWQGVLTETKQDQALEEMNK